LEHSGFPVRNKAMLFVLLTALFQQTADTAPASASFVFRDASALDGRSILHFRALEFANTPIRPLHAESTIGEGALYSLLPVGSNPEDALTVVWNPKAAGGPQIWVDTDHEDKFTASKMRRFDKAELKVPINLTVNRHQGGGKVTRTVVFRRSGLGHGLMYAVRGIAEGKLLLGSETYRAILVDGNADGCFDTAGSDRIWIDLNGDGRFDPLTEQFLLGSPITANGNVYIIRSDATASEVRVYPRTKETGTVRLTLTGNADSRVSRVAMQLVSDAGELVSVAQLDKPISLLAGRYRADSVQFSLVDHFGVNWSYRFAGGRRYAIVIAPGKESNAVLLDGLALRVSVPSINQKVNAGQALSVTPHLRTSCGLYLADCQTLAKGAFQLTSSGAQIQLRNSVSEIVDHAVSGFM
jgi:hypothetical protein